MTETGKAAPRRIGERLSAITQRRSTRGTRYATSAEALESLLRHRREGMPRFRAWQKEKVKA